ncbi:MAG: hypothetical protein LC768_07445 [Acidobacteria bacterium]|nr:hypothetical protein [Acidobacteriota bacterium]MCA1638156.1 hypothetical protein [Acidobacteriota bacterium]
MLKKTLDDYRKGAIGSLMDEYERVAFELKFVLQKYWRTRLHANRRRRD